MIGIQSEYFIIGGFYEARVFMYLAGGGVLLIQDQEEKIDLSGEMLHKILEDLEEYRWRINSEEQRKEFKDLEVFVIIEYCGGLRR